jgi:excisionase family DNA binding protein
MEDWLTVEEGAAYVKVPKRTFLDWIRKGTIKAYTLSGTKRRVYRVRKQDIDSELLAKPVVDSRVPAVSQRKVGRAA